MREQRFNRTESPIATSTTPLVIELYKDVTKYYAQSEKAKHMYLIIEVVLESRIWRVGRGSQHSIK